MTLQEAALPLGTQPLCGGLRGAAARTRRALSCGAGCRLCAGLWQQVVLSVRLPAASGLRGAPLQPPTSQGVADPLQASSFEAVLASPAPQRYEMSPFQVFQGAVPSPSSFREHYVRHSYELQLLPRLLCSA